jgi:hypothetical protein
MRRRSARRLFAILVLSLPLVTAVASASAGAGSSIALGSNAFAKPDGEGWGAARPARIYNGGDPSGRVTEIQWTSWGGGVAIGYGLGSIFKPGGGYYGRPVLVELRAQRLGRCGSQRAYTQLAIRSPPKPEASVGSWHLWSDAKSLCNFGF